MFVDVGRVDDGDPEYLTWQELETVQDERPLAAPAPLGQRPPADPVRARPERLRPLLRLRAAGRGLRRLAAAGALGHRLGPGRRSQTTSPAYRPLAFSPPYGNYGQDGTNDPRIPDDLLGWLTQRYGAVFTQDRNARAHRGSGQPLGRIQVTRATTGGDLHAKLLSGG